VTRSMTEAWRMHPGVCGFVSERSYDSRLRSRPCELHSIDAPLGVLLGAGLRSIAVEHEGRSHPRRPRRSPRASRGSAPNDARPMRGAIGARTVGDPLRRWREVTRRPPMGALASSRPDPTGVGQEAASQMGDL
jgi:hypothetical protein